MASGVTLEEAEGKKPDGFFPKLFENVCKNLSNDELDKTTQYKDDVDTLVRFTYDLKQLRQGLQIREFYPEKNSHESKIKKEYGNKAYQDGKDIDALYFYTQAVISARVDETTGKSKELSVALANRSAVLVSLKAYHLALDDIKLAFEMGYPEELRFKLLERKAKILMLGKQFSDAQDTYKELIKSLDVAKCDSNKKLKIQNEAQKALIYFKKAPSVYNDRNVAIYPQAQLPKIKDKNMKYPAMSSAVAFKYQENRGRYGVASRDIAVGEFLCVEDPAVSHMLPDYMGSNCTHCFKSMKAPLPCPRCTKVLFCSYKCRQEALSTYHKYECTVVDFLIASGMSIICFLAYRCISQKPLQFFLENKNLFDGHDIASGTAKGQEAVSRYLSKDYRNLYNLVTHHEERKAGDCFHRALLTCMLLRCLKKLGYFGTEAAATMKNPSELGEVGDFEDTDVLSDDEAFIGTLLFHFLEVLQFNAHEVAQFEMLARDKEEGAKSVFIGAAVYPTLAMFNHSCDPSIVRFYVEDKVCVQAIKNISKGEEISENYGPIFFHSGREDRKERLKKQYWFDCACIPCQENWPLMHEMGDDHLNFKCAVCSGSCLFSTSATNPMLRCQCGTPVPVLQTLKAITESEILHEKAKDAMASGKLALAQEQYSKYLTLLDKHLAPPYPDYYKIQQSIWKCIWMRFGNRVVRANAPKAAVGEEDDYDIVD